MDTFGVWVLNNTGKVLGLAFLVCVLGVMGALKLEVNESWVENFRTTEPIFLADKAINATLDGTNNLDIVIETPNNEDLFKPENLHRIEALQTFLTTLPHINGSTSIVDYIKQMNRSLNENKPSAYVIPDDADLISQYFLLYSVSGDPTDFEEEIDYDYRKALVRARMDSARYQRNEVVVQATQKYLDETFNNCDIKGTLSGRVNVDYHWLDTLLGTQYKSVTIASGISLDHCLYQFTLNLWWHISRCPSHIGLLVCVCLYGNGWDNTSRWYIHDSCHSTRNRCGFFHSYFGSNQIINFRTWA